MVFFFFGFLLQKYHRDYIYNRSILNTLISHTKGTLLDFCIRIQNQDDVILRTGSGGLGAHIITMTMLYFEQGPGILVYISLPRRCYTSNRVRGTYCTYHYQDDVILRTGSGGLSVHIITKTMLYFEQGLGVLVYISLPRRCYTSNRVWGS